MAHPYPCPPETMQNILSCIPHLYTWTYDPDGTLIATTCPNRAIFHELFFQCDYMQQIRITQKCLLSLRPQHLHGSGLVRSSGKEENILEKIYLLGPVFQYPVSPRRLDNVLRGIRRPGNEFPVPPSALQAMKDLPVIPITQLEASYAIMLPLLRQRPSGWTYRDLNALKDTPEDAESFPEKREESGRPRRRKVIRRNLWNPSYAGTRFGGV